MYVCMKAKEHLSATMSKKAENPVSWPSGRHTATWMANGSGSAGCSSSHKGLLWLGHGLSVSPKVCIQKVCFPTTEGVQSFSR